MNKEARALLCSNERRVLHVYSRNPIHQGEQGLEHFLNCLIQLSGWVWGRAAGRRIRM